MATLTITPGYVWVDGEVETATKFNLTATPTVGSDQSYTFSVGSSALPSVNFTGFTTAGFYYSGGVGVSVGGASVGLFTGSGLNACAVGATTPSTGSFTSIAGTIAAGGAAAIFNASTGTAGTGMFLRLQRGGTNTWDVGTGISLGSDIFEIYNRTTGATAIQISAATNAVAVTGALTTNGGLQTFGASDSAGAGFRLVRVPN